MDSNIQTRWAEPADLPAVAEFCAATFGSDSFQADPRRLDWLYRSHPLGMHVALAEAGGRIVACCGHLPQPVRVGSETVTAGFGIDFMVHPDWRRKGLGAVVLDMRLARFRLSLSTGQSAAMLALYRRHGAQDLGPVLHARARTRWPGLVPSRAGAAALLEWWRGRRLVADRVPARKLRLDGFLSEAARAGHRSDLLSWLEWRYGGQVYGGHQFLELGGGAGGLVVVRREGPTLVVLDWLAPDGAGLPDPTSFDPDSPDVRMMVAGSLLARRVARSGFRLVPSGARLVGLTRDSALGRTLAAEGCELCGGTADMEIMRHPDAVDT